MQKLANLQPAILDYELLPIPEKYELQNNRSGNRRIKQVLRQFFDR